MVAGKLAPAFTLEDARAAGFTKDQVYSSTRQPSRSGVNVPTRGRGQGGDLLGGAEHR